MASFFGLVDPDPARRTRVLEGAQLEKSPFSAPPRVLAPNGMVETSGYRLLTGFLLWAGSHLS